ncbi:MAG TPA: hypothetical protein VGK31_06330 [Thermoanaerobaculia bacterium]
MPAYEIPKSLLRLGAIASIAAGILITTGFALHPAGEDATYGTDPFWVPAHGVLWLAFVVALLGWIAVYVVQASSAGRLGVVAFVVVIVGTSLASWIFSSDVAFVPVIAAESPGLFKKIFTPPHLVLGLVSVLSWVAGVVLFGVSVIRAKVFRRSAGVLLAIGPVIIPIAYLSGLSVRFVAIGGGIMAAGQIWLGYDLLRMLGRSTAGHTR